MTDNSLPFTLVDTTEGHLLSATTERARQALAWAVGFAPGSPAYEAFMGATFSDIGSAGRALVLARQHMEVLA